MLKNSMLVGAVMALIAGPAFAQANNAINVFGVVDKVDAASISVKNNEGGAVDAYKIAPNVLYIEQKDTTLADINPLLERVANTRIGDEPCPGFSYGAAECPSEAEDAEALFNLADQRLLAAKAARS